MTHPQHPQLTPLTEGAGDYLDVRVRQGQLMLVRVWDVAQEVITANNPDGWVYPRDKSKEPFPNSVVRAAIVDLGVNGADGLPGKVYPEAWIQASSIMKEAKKWKGQLKLVLWKQKDPADKSSLYDVYDMSGDSNAVAVFENFINRHPEFYDLVAPEPYEPRKREQRQPPGMQQTPQQPWGPQVPYQGQQQPGYYGQQPPQQPWQPPVPPQQAPSQWNTAAPPPDYYTQQPQWAQQSQNAQPTTPAGHFNPQYGVPQVQQYPTVQPPQSPDPWAQQQGQQPYSGPPAQQGPPPQQWQPQQPQQAPQGAPGSFFQASQGQQGPQPPRQVNHQGWPQDQDPPF